MANEGDVLQIAGGHQAFVANVLKVGTKHLVAADMLALASGPHPLIVPGSAGKVLFPVAATAVLTAGMTPYLAGGDLTIGVGDQVAFVLSIAGTFVQNASDDFGYFGFLNSSASGNFGSGLLDGEGIYIWIDSGDPTLGDGTVDIEVLYREIDVS